MKKYLKLLKVMGYIALTIFGLALLFVLVLMFLVLWKLVIAVFILVLMLLTSFVKVEADKYALIKLSIPFLPNPKGGHIIARGFQQGIRPETYGPGLHFIPFVKFPGVSKIIPKSLVKIPSGRFGLISAEDGEPLEKGQLLAERAVECKNFTDGSAFIELGGQRSIQIPLISAGSYPINEFMFEKKDIDPVTIEKKETEIELVKGEGKKKELTPFVGLVTLNIGAEIPEADDRIIAHRVEGHNNFQNLGPFLAPQLEKRLKKEVKRKLAESEEEWEVRKAQWLTKNTLEKGIQLDVLEPGSYLLHPVATKVEQVPVPYVKAGQVGVLIANIGRSPDLDSSNIEEKIEIIRPPQEVQIKFKTGYIVKPAAESNYRGIRLKTLNPGFVSYPYANRVAYQLVMINTTPITVDFTSEKEFKEHKHISGVRFEPIEVVTKEGFTVPAKVELVIMIPSENAPRVVALAGSEVGLINDVIVTIADDIIKRIVSEKDLLSLVKKREKIRKAIEDGIKNFLTTDKFYIQVQSFRIRKFDFEQSPDKNAPEFVNILAEQTTVEQRQKLIKKQQGVQRERINFEHLKAQADNQNILVRAEFQKKASTDQKEAIRQRAEALTNLGPVQALVADADALAGIAQGLINIGENLTKTAKKES